MSWATATARAPDGGRLIDHHQHQALVDLSQLVLVVGQGPVEDPPPVPAQGRGPVLCLTDVDADEDVDVLDIHLRAASRCMGAGPASGRPDPAPTPAKDLYRFAASRSPYQQSPAPDCRR